MSVSLSMSASYSGQEEGIGYVDPYTVEFSLADPASLAAFSTSDPLTSFSFESLLKSGQAVPAHGTDGVGRAIVV